jgi:SAM-dependent methyltransferase
LPKVLIELALCSMGIEMNEEDLNRRLESERIFQNQRTESIAIGEVEAKRGRFYYLSKNAFKRYYQTLEDVEGKRVIVVGCERGGVTPLAHRGAIVTGVDIADHAIKLLNQAIENEGLTANARALVMNGEDLQLPANSADLICCTGVLHHLDVEKAAESWARTLAPNGRVTMIEPMAWHPVVFLYRIFTPHMRTPDEHPLTPKDIKALRRHFGKVKVQGFVLTSVLSVAATYLPNGQSLTNLSFRLLENVDRFLLKFFPFLVYCCWTSVIELEAPLYTNNTGLSQIKS